MPLRDHFRPPLDNLRHWESLHGGWPMMIVADLRKKLPAGLFAELQVHLGSAAEIDVATFENEADILATGNGNGSGGVATAVWAPALPTLAVATDLPTQDVYEVLVYDERRRCRLVAAVEIVSPANKDRPEHRRAFTSNCAGLLRERVSVVIVDVVTTRNQNLYGEMLELIGLSEPGSAARSTFTLHRCVPVDEARQRVVPRELANKPGRRPTSSDHAAMARRQPGRAA